MKTIFISIYDGDTEKVILRSGVFAQLKAGKYRIVLLIRGAGRMEYYREAFADENVAVELLPAAANFLEHIWYNISWNSVPTHSVLLRKKIRFLHNRKYFRYVLQSALWLLGHVRIWRELLRTVYRLWPDAYADDLFKRYTPDLLFAPNMFSPEDCRLLRAARRRGIPTITTVKSWDVLTTKAFTRVKADIILAFNDIIRKEAISLGDYAQSAVVVTGFPQFDPYANPALLETREEFLKKMQVDPATRVILLAVPGTWQATHTQDILRELNTRIAQGKFSKPIVVLARLHPKYPDACEELHLEHVRIERPGTHFDSKKEFSIDMGVHGLYPWTFTDVDIARLANSLYHSDMVINHASTVTLDAAAYRRPAILIGYDGNVTLPYLQSAMRWYDFNHYRNIVETGAAPIVRSHDELEAAINAFLENPDYLLKEREALLEQFLYRLDGKASERTVLAIESLL